MRPIKFRGKRVDTGEWVYGLPVIFGIGSIIITAMSMTHDPDGTELDIKEGYEVIPETVGQYTERKDTNGVEIFDGDVFHGKRDNCTVYWNKKYFGWYIKNKTEGKDLLVSQVVDYHMLHVIGNIHDNPELLEGGDD